MSPCNIEKAVAHVFVVPWAAVADYSFPGNIFKECLHLIVDIII